VKENSNRKARRLDITEGIYYEIIRKKTATLIAACCALGAQSVIDDELQVENMRKFGELIGMAFQIKDDLFDYTDEAIGKPTGIDIKEQKMTLPLIHVLNTCTAKEKSWLINSIKTTIKIKKESKKLLHLSKTTVYSTPRQKWLNFSKKHYFIDIYPQSDFKDALILMVNYVIERKNNSILSF
jgi:octaprenyl-diphosphate synthase